MVDVCASYGLKVERTKTAALAKCTGDGSRDTLFHQNNSAQQVLTTLGPMVIPTVRQFKSLGSLHNEHASMKADIQQRAQKNELQFKR